MTDLVIIDKKDYSEVYRETLDAAQRLPPAYSYVWVSGNGDIAYLLHGYHHDFRSDEVIGLAAKSPKQVHPVKDTNQ